MIELEAVSVVFGRRREVVALEDIELVVGKGELVVVTGPSGAGKTTLVRVIAGLLAPDAGTVRLFGHDLQRLRSSSLSLVRRRVGVVHQDLKLLPDRTALANVGVPLELLALPRTEIRARAAEALASVGLAWKVDTLVAHLSLGEQQRVALARAFVAEPSMIIADEPTGNLDRGHTEDLLWQLSELNNGGVTVVLTTNDHDVIEAAGRNGWRKLVLEAGRLADWATAAAPETVTETEIEIDIDSESAPNVVPFPRVAAAGGKGE